MPGKLFTTAASGCRANASGGGGEVVGGEVVGGEVVGGAAGGVELQDQRLGLPAHSCLDQW
jgi:hypothetical protein